MVKRILSQMHILDFAEIVGKISAQFYASKDAKLGRLDVDGMPYKYVYNLAIDDSYTTRTIFPPQKIRELFREAYRKVPGEFKRRSSDFAAQVGTCRLNGGEFYANFTTDVYNKTVLEEILGFPSLSEGLNEFLIKIRMPGRSDWGFPYGRNQWDSLGNVFPQFEAFVFRRLGEISSAQKSRRVSGIVDFISDFESGEQ